MQDGNQDEARREFDLAVDALLAVPAHSPDRCITDKRLEDLVRQIRRYDAERLGAGISPDSPIFVKAPIGEILEMTFPVDPRLKDRTLAIVQSGQSQIPLVVNDAVASYISFFTSPRGSRTFLYGMKYAGRYRPMIERIFAEEGVPAELIHLAQAESGFQPTALSPKAAAGMWQFMRFRGVEYGLTHSALHDDRLDPEKATRAAARHLRDLYHQLGDWHLVMAGYNCGPNCVEKAVQRTGYADYWEMVRRNALPRETRNYVPAILAMTIIARNPEAYGLELLEPERPLEYEKVTITAPTNLGLIADAADRPVADLRELNPALIKGVAPANYELKVPMGLTARIAAALDMVPAEKRISWRLHRVARGDTLASIARQYATAPQSILSANAKLAHSSLEEAEDGEVLLIPVAAKPLVTPVRRTTGTAARARGKSGAPATAARPVAKAAARPAPPVSKTTQLARR